MTTKKNALEAMDPEARREFCRQVLENLSDLVEGDAPDDLCRRVEELLSDCRPFVAFRDTFEATIRLAHGLGEETQLDDDAYSRCVENVRQSLRKDRTC